MGQVSVTFNNQEHHLACKDGEEERLYMLADYIKEKASALTDRMGPIGDVRLLLMTAIILADEIHDLNDGKIPENQDDEIKRMDVAMGKAVLRIEELARSLEA